MKDFSKQKLLLFLAASSAGYLFNALAVPIPYIIGGILVSFIAKTFIDPTTF